VGLLAIDKSFAHIDAFSVIEQTFFNVRVKEAYF